MMPLRNAAMIESILSIKNQRWQPETDTSLNVNGHFRGNIVYTTIEVRHCIGLQ